MPSDLTSDYLGRVHGTLVETGKQINSVLLAQTVVSLIVLALCLDVVSTDPEYAIAGLKLHIAAPVVLVAGCVAAAVLLLFQVGLVQHEAALGVIVRDLYAELGFDHPTLQDREANPLEAPNVVTSIISLSRQGRVGPKLSAATYAIARTVAILMFVGLPLAAQVAVAWKLQQSRAAPWWLAIPVATLLSSCLYLQFLFRHAGRKSRPNSAVEPTSAQHLIRLLSRFSRGPKRLTLDR